MQPFSKLCLTILLAHLLGDFPFQPSGMVQRKSKGIRGYIQHGAIHFVVLVVCIGAFVGTQVLWSYRIWMVLSLYVGVHLLIDVSKQRLVNSRRLADSAGLFVCDQALHVFTIGAVAWFLVRPTWATLRAEFSWSPATGEKVLEAGIVYIAVIFAGGYAIRYLTRNLAKGIHTPGETSEQLKNAGMYIGWLERFLVITAVLVQAPSMVGLILTGKSIARFPEFKERFAEYFLIGTFLSVGLAILGGLMLLKLWYGTTSLK
jgi:Protein of unknown function (DUF3307)